MAPVAAKLFTFLAVDFAVLPSGLLRSARMVAPVSRRLIAAATASMWLYSSVAILQMRS